MGWPRKLSEAEKNTIYSAFVIAIGIALYWWMFFEMGHLSGRNQERAQIEREHYAADAAENMERSCSNLSGAALRECARKVVNSERESKREESDLAAQWNAADWARWATVVAGAQLIATILGLYFIKHTLDATRAAVQEAGDATEAAREAVRETSRVGEAQARAYLSVVQASFHVDRRPRQLTDIPNYELMLKFHNSGGTPAVNVSYYCEARVSTWSDTETPPDLSTVPFHHFVTNKPPGEPGEIKAICYGLMPRWSEFQDNWAKVTRDTTFGQMPNLIICGIVFYEDVFGATFRSQFGFMFGQKPPKDGDPVGSDDLTTLQACIPTFERISDRRNYIERPSD